MKNCISFFARVGALAAVLCALLLSLSFAADSAPCAGGAEGVNCVKELRLGGSEVMTIQKPSFKMKVITSDEDIVDARPLKEDKIYIRGKKLGYCTVTVWDELTKQVTAVIDVTVTLDLTGLKQRLYELYPDEDIQVRGSEKGVVLSGTVSGPEVVEQVLRLTQNFLPRQATGAGGRGGGGGGTGGGTSGIGITNLLKVGALQQVLLEVKFAEVKRESTKDWQAALGLINQGKELNVGAGAAPLGLTKSGSLPTFGQSGSILLNFAGNSANIFANIDNLTAALEFLETESLSRTLAEPRLVTLSGQEASFLAGGEFPFQTVDALGQTDVEFKDFGVGLKFTPVVHSDGKITLRVFPSVSDIVDFVDTSTGPQAVFDTRQLESTVQLYDGQTLALAGLLKDNMVNVVNKVPGLGDIPILGSLFRSSSYLQQKTDLLVAVTPHIVRPVKEGAISYPGEFMTAPNRLEFYLEGRLEGRRPAGGPSAFGDHSFAMPEMMQGEQGGLEGEFGQQPVAAN